jgi:FkbM family methyltransferase
VELPWGLPLEVYRSDAIGFSIIAGRIFDPCITETLHRLIDPGDLVVDVGAHVGYITSLAAVRAGRDGSVIAFEPHPTVSELLAANAARWGTAEDIAPVEIRHEALSDRSGTGELDPGPAFTDNMGLASLREPGGDETPGTLLVSLQRLDDVIRARSVGLLKIDVEGHEHAVLRGAGRLLSERLIRDIVFEDHNPYPSDATRVAEEAGYRLLSLANSLFGLRLSAPEARGDIAGWPGPSYLATLAEGRARRRLGPRGWQVKGIGPLPPLIRRRD